MQVVFKNDTRSCGSCHWGAWNVDNQGKCSQCAHWSMWKKRVDPVLVKGEADARAKD
jgi:hypothetical protein